MAASVCIFYNFPCCFRALKTIIPREEEERLNVWVAYFNLENEYGSPREVKLSYIFVFLSVVVLGYTDTSVDVHQDAVKKVFQRALQYCDHKKLHLALLALYERTEQYQLADELLDRMTKRFKTSCKVCLSVSFFSGRGSELFPIFIWRIT